MDKNIHNLIEGFVYPDVSERIRDYNKYDEKRRYETILSRLCYHAKTYISKKKFTSYIQFKDDEGKFIFNDALNISAYGNFDMIDSSREYNVDLIKDSKEKHLLYYITTYKSNKGLETGFGGVKFKKPISEISIMEYIEASGMALEDQLAYQQEQGVVFKKDFFVSVNLLLHQYNAGTKTWDMESPFDNIRVVKGPNNF